MKTTIIIPARYGSTRLPGKPLALIAGKTMVSRVYELAKHAAKNMEGVDVVVATDDDRIMQHCVEIGAKCVMTPVECPTGTDRACAAIDKLGYEPKFVLNLQGDAPLTPPWFITAMLNEFQNNPNAEVVTPCVQLTWEELDTLREHKKETPFSGTCVVMKKNNDALWFSKNIIPAIRKEEKLRSSSDHSPVYRHIGLYGYSYKTLKKFMQTEEGFYENLEGLEQLRMLENGYNIRMVKVSYNDKLGMSGVDSPEDIDRAEKIIAEQGELI